MEPTSAPDFVIALCAMDRQIPIPQPRSSPLNRFRFFLTRRRANGREFFVLQMGHFTSAAEAEKWLRLLRGTYPNAYVIDTSEPLVLAANAALSDTQVLRVLEVRHPVPDEPTEEPARATVVKEKPRSSLDQSLENLAAREELEFGTGAYEALSETGVRHLRIEVEKKRPTSLFRRPRTRIR
jgi:hypothetical protein